MTNNNEQQMEQNRTIIIDPGQLPVFSVANAIHTSYTTAIVRVANALNLGTFEPIDTFLYRVYINNNLTEENCCIVQKGADEYEPTGLPFEVFITFMTILQVKTFQATYSGGGATIYIMDDDLVSRVEALFVSRPEFELWDILCLGGEGDGGYEEEAQEKE